MAKEMNTVVKMTINSKDYEKGLQNCKSSMNKFSLSTKNVGDSFNAVMGGMVKKIGLVGIALAAKDGFKAFMTSTETMADSFANEIGAMSDSWKSMLFQINNGNLQGFQDVIDYARQARQALDELGDASALFQIDLGANSAKATELLSTIQKKKKSGQDYSQEMTDYNALVAQLREDSKLANEKSIEALEGMFGQKGISIGDYGVSYMEAVRLARLSAAGAFADVNALNKAYATNIDLDEVSDFSSELPKSKVKQLQEAWGMSRFNRAQFLRTLGNIPTEDKEAIEKVIKEISQRDQAVASMEKALNRYLGSEGTGKPSTKASVKADAKLTIDQEMEYLSKALQNEILNNDRLKDSIIIDIELEDEDIVEPELDALIEKVRQLNAEWENNIKNISLYGNVIGNAAAAFSAIGDAMGDTPFGAFMSTMGTVAQQIANLVSMYTSLVAVEGVAESIKAGNGIPFPYNLIAIASSVAALATIISSAKSNFAGKFADGGIVPGNSYTGDKLFARVNSGEMILNKAQQAALFGNAGGNVHFIIEGSQLRGVLDNYDKTSNL